jgi:hypothetical protein
MRYPVGAPTGCCFSAAMLKEYWFEEFHYAEDFDLILRLLEDEKEIIIHRAPAVAIAFNDEQYSATWHHTGGFIRDVTAVMQKHFTGRDQRIVESVGDRIDSWSNREIARLLMFMAHAGFMNSVQELESRIHRTSYKGERAYRQVWLAKRVGSQTMGMIYRLSKRVRQQVPQRKL